MKANELQFIDDNGAHSLEQLVDELGEIKAQLASLSKREKLLKGKLADAAGMLGVSAFDGIYFRATVSHSERHHIDFKTLIADLALNEADLEPYDRTSSVTTVRVSARRSS